MVNTALLFGHSQQIHLIQGYEDKTGNCEKKTEKEEEKSWFYICHVNIFEMTDWKFIKADEVFGSGWEC